MFSQNKQITEKSENKTSSNKYLSSNIPFHLKTFPAHYSSAVNHNKNDHCPHFRRQRNNGHKRSEKCDHTTNRLANWRMPFIKSAKNFHKTKIRISKHTNGAHRKSSARIAFDLQKV